MWDNQRSSGMHPKIKVVDGVSEGEVGLELHTKNHGGRMGAQEEITDDDVFKELINIVMDVFSNKSEKCVLTFELPAASGVLKEISPEELATGNSSDVSSNASKSDILIPLRDSKYTRKWLNRRRRKLKAPTAKTSKKYKVKKKLKKTLSPILQTALHPKPGFTDLERLFRMRPKQSHLTNGGCNDRHETVVGSSRKVADGWRDIAERDALLKDVSNLKIAYPLQGTSTGIDEFSNLHSEFRTVLEALEELAHSQEVIPGRTSFGELSYHLEEILCHIKAISNSLQDSQSFESVDTTRQLTSTTSSEAPKRKNKVGVKLIRIGAKICQKSSMQALSKKSRKRKEYKQEYIGDAGLGEILKKYQKVKKEETEIVRVLLGKLGFHKDHSNHKFRKRRSKTPEQELFEKIEAAQPCNVTAEEIQCREVARNARDIHEDLNEDVVQEMAKEPQNNMNNDLTSKRLVQMSVLENERDSKRRKRGVQKDVSRRKKKHREPRNKSRIISKISKDYAEIDGSSKKYSPIILYECPPPVFTERREEIMDNSSKEEIRNFTEVQHPGAANKEERIMRRIQTAARRLEYTHSLVEKKLNHLSKQQKELNRKITGKTCGGYTPRESRSNSQIDDDLPQGSILNLSPEIEELIFQPCRNVRLDEFKCLKEPLNCHVNEPHGIVEVSKNGKFGETSSSALQTQESLNKTNTTDTTEQFHCEGNHNYICNYMMEMRGKELQHISTGSTQHEPGSEHSGIGNFFPSTVLTNEFQENSSSNGHNKDPPTRSLLSVTTKAENEGEIIEESLFAKPLSSDKNVQKPNVRKKKKRVIHTPSCALS